MKPLYHYLQDPRPRGRLALVRSSAAVVIAVAVLAIAALVPHATRPGDTVGTEFSDAANSMPGAPSARVPEHIRESAGGVDPLHPHEYVGQPSVF